MGNRKPITQSGTDRVGQHVAIVPHKIETDSTTTANKLYVGKADAGVAKSAAGWLIVRYDTSGNFSTDGFPDGVASFNQIWNDRTSLSYS